jgi:maleate isomerase
VAEPVAETAEVQQQLRSPRVTIGVITPHAAAGPEAEWPLLTDRQVDTRVARIPAPGGTTTEPGTPPTSPAGLGSLANPDLLGGAVTSLLRRGPVDAIGYASTSTGYVIGHAAETALMEQLSRRYGVPMDSTSAAVVTALQTLGVERLQLVHPPWFDPEMNELGAAYFQNEGFEVVAAASAQLPDDPREIQTADVATWVANHLHDAAQAVVMGGNGFRVAGAVKPLEERIGRPVLAPNPALLWALLKRMRITLSASGRGSLFRH